MPNLFDLPFEEAEPEPDPEPLAPPAKPAPPRPLSVKPQPPTATEERVPQKPVEPQTFRTRIEALRGDTKAQTPPAQTPGTSAKSPDASIAPPAHAVISGGEPPPSSASRIPGTAPRGSAPIGSRGVQSSEPGGAPSIAPPARAVISVSELNANIRDLLEGTMFDVWVEGEISNCRLWNTGHLYFTLKDRSAQIKAVMFKSAVRYLRFKPEDGQHVVARGRVSVYEPKGEYQIVCEVIEPKGLGALQLAFEQLKKKLDAEGLFAAARKRPLPTLPRRIGIVTSLDGAAVRDIIKVLQQRHAAVPLLIRPCRVQGDGAAAEVAQALRQIVRAKNIDVVIVGRGGGSLEDLRAFNDEIVARAIAASPVPVISAVGHEVDFTIADFVADVRAATPSNAAELVVARHDQFCQRIDHLDHRMTALLRHRIQQRRASVHLLATRRGLVSVRTRVGMRGRHVAELLHDLRGAVTGHLQRERRALHDLRVRLEAVDQRRRLARLRARLVAADGQLAARAQAARHRADGRLRTLAGRLENLSPLAVLSRGYAVCWAADGRTIVRDATTITPGDTVHVGVERGALQCTVTNVREER
jgi:exodeoxyribonuclease VII large subunit